VLSRLVVDTTPIIIVMSTASATVPRGDREPLPGMLPWQYIPSMWIGGGSDQPHIDNINTYTAGATTNYGVYYISLKHEDLRVKCDVKARSV
jgi:hypothetical protein